MGGKVHQMCRGEMMFDFNSLEKRSIEERIIIAKTLMQTILDDFPSQDKCGGCFYQNRMGLSCEYCSRRYPDRYVREEQQNE